MKSICFVVATKDRPDDLRRMLESFAAQTIRPNLLIVVDSGTVRISDVVSDFEERLRVRYLYHQPPSASAQRNAGIEATPANIELIGFLDDDATLEAEALERMLAFWANAPSDLGGAAFNMVNYPLQTISRVKRWPLVSMLGVYSGEPGQVTPSGWQTMIGFVSQDIEVDWLPSTAAVWRSKIMRTCRFDEFFNGYSYLEDLDFSYTVGRRWRLAVVADARYCHYPSPIRHARQHGFGETEVRNRLYFVRKHRLSVPNCWLGLMLRMGMSIGEAVARLDRGPLDRALGNLAAMTAELKSLLAGQRLTSKDE